MTREYRKDIDGIRAIAVLLVLLFHVEVSNLSGGFIGVDVFFTLSGFLISGILIRALDQEKFSFKDFYIRRALRILPVYILVVGVSILFAFILLPPLALMDMLEGALASSLFMSNMYFLIVHGGYFSSSIHEQVLLHTWSLSVEEQFYLITPILLLIWYKYIPPKFKLSVIGGLCILGLLVSFVVTQVNASIAYYVVITRAFEFFLGTLLAYYLYQNKDNSVPSTNVSNLVAVTSLLTLIAVATQVNAKTLFPGWIAALPCLATIGLIYAGQNKQGISFKILSNKFLAFIGLISYSMYLWHWPIVAFLKNAGVSFSILIQCSVVLVTIGLSILSWKFVEQKARYTNFTRKGLLALIYYLAPVLVIFIIMLFAQNNQYFPKRFDSHIVDVESAWKSYPDVWRGKCHSNDFDEHTKANCQLGDSNAEKRAILWGDSHANHFSGALDVLGKVKHLNIADFTMGNCPPLPNLYIDLPNARQSCVNKNKEVIKYILDAKPNIVFLAGAWQGYKADDYNSIDGVNASIYDELTRVVSSLEASNIKVYVFSMIPRMQKDVSGCYLKHLKNQEIVSLDKCRFLQANSRNVLLEMELAFDNLTVIDVGQYYCDKNDCQSWLEGVPLYRDNNHFSLDGSRIIGAKMANDINL